MGSKTLTSLLLSCCLLTMGVANESKTKQEKTSLWEKFFEVEKPFIEESMGMTFSGGSVQRKGKVAVLTPIHIELPGYQSDGCHSFNFTLGGVTFASGKEIKEVAKQIVRNSPALLADVAMSVVSPIIASSQQKITSLAAMFNGHRITSCWLQQQLKNTVTDQLARGQQTLCAKSQLREGKNFFNVLCDNVKYTKHQDEAKDTLSGEFDLTGKIIAEEFASDFLLRDLEQLAANIFGTIKNTPVTKKESVKSTNEAGKTKETTEVFTDKFELQILPPKFDAIWAQLFSKLDKQSNDSSTNATKANAASDFYYFDSVSKKIAIASEKQAKALKIGQELELRAKELSKGMQSLIGKIQTERKNTDISLSPEEIALFRYEHMPIGTWCMSLAVVTQDINAFPLEKLARLTLATRFCSVLHSAATRIETGLAKMAVDEAQKELLGQYREQIGQIHQKIQTLLQEEKRNLASDLEFVELLQKSFTNARFSTQSGEKND